MRSVTLLFPGQGSQYVGMGDSLRELPKAAEIFERADKALGFSISQICSEGPEPELKLTKNTQPAILTHSIALYSVLADFCQEHAIKIDRVLGHSVGEYAALVAAGSLSFEDAVVAVHNRGKFMQEAVAPGHGKMYAILRVPAEMVEKACRAVSDDKEQVMCANFNDPTQIVISGHANACDLAVQWLKDNYDGKQMAKELPVSAPFHSSLMQPAEKKLAEFFDSLTFNSNEVPYVANIDAVSYQSDGETIKNNLIRQVCGSVLWTQSIQTLADSTVCLEVGPGKVLTGLNKRINPQLKTLNLDQEHGFEKILELFQ